MFSLSILFIIFLSLLFSFCTFGFSLCIIPCLV